MQLSIIIVNYKVKYFCEQCLHAVMQAAIDIEAEVILLDNNSSDGSIEYLKPKFPQVKFIALNENTGFARANNRALQMAKGEYILFLNPDTIIGENSLKDCINFLGGHANAGAAGVQMVDGTGAFLPESKRAFPSPIVSFYKLCGLAALFPRSKIFNRYALGNLDKNTLQRSPVLCGAFFMSRRDLLLQLNGFDEDYFMYGEDIDLSYRIEKAGYKNYYLGNTTIIHFKGESTKRGSFNHTKQFYSAMIIFVRKHYTGSKAIILRIFLQAAIILRAFLSLVSVPVSLVKGRYKPHENKERVISLAGNSADIKTARAILDGKSFRADHIPEQQIQSLKKIPGNAIIFCTGHLQYAETIQYIKLFGRAYHYQWHHKNSFSIAGSADKNGTGEVYAI